MWNHGRLRLKPRDIYLTSQSIYLGYSCLDGLLLMRIKIPGTGKDAKRWAAPHPQGREAE